MENAYEQKQKEKAEYYREKAKQAAHNANQAYNQSTRIADQIPFGQPILIGHHSEGHARSDQTKIHNLMQKSITEQEKADYYARRAENATNPQFISSDDPEAVNKLKEKLTVLKEKHAILKKLPKEKREWYTLPYSSAEIKRVEKRIQLLEAKQDLEDVDKIVKGVRVKTDKQDNRLRLYFPAVPGEETRLQLKRHGFLWSPTNKAWQRKISNAAFYAMECVLQSVDFEVKSEVV